MQLHETCPAQWVTLHNINLFCKGDVVRSLFMHVHYLYRSSIFLVGNLRISVETAACSDAQYVTPPLILQFQRVEALTNYQQ